MDISVTYESNLKATLLQVASKRDKYQEEKRKVETCEKRLSDLNTQKTLCMGKLESVNAMIRKVSGEISGLKKEIRSSHVRTENHIRRQRPGF